VLVFRLREYHYFLIFLGGHLVSHLPDLKKYKDMPGYYSIGASGGVSALVFGYVAMDPTAMFLVFLIPMPAYLFALLFLAYSAYGARKMASVNHAAHIWGALYGFFITFVIHPTLVERWKAWMISWF
jgi:membrane associated rhomboid family serine protease